MLARQRQASILDSVRERGAVRVAELVESLAVSEMTVRRDLDALAERGLVTRVHGGVIAVSGASDEPGYAVVDILRIDGGYIREHWDVLQEVPDPATSKNSNGMF